MHMRKLFSLIVALVVLPLAARAGSDANDPKLLVTRLESCEAILQEFQSDPATAIPAAILRQAKALVIANEFQAGFLIGGKGGYGVALVRQADGRWSIPTFLIAGEASLGFQLGAKSVNTVYVINDDTGARLLYHPRFNFGVDAGAVAGPLESNLQEATQIIKAPVYVYQTQNGVFAGAKLKSGWLASDDDRNQRYYKTVRTMPELLFANWVTPPPAARELRDYVQSIAGN
jgi:lipid-binding SYLF domain-containing protein